MCIHLQYSHALLMVHKDNAVRYTCIGNSRSIPATRVWVELRNLFVQVLKSCLIVIVAIVTQQLAKSYLKLIKRVEPMEFACDINSCFRFMCLNDTLILIARKTAKI